MKNKISFGVKEIGKIEINKNISWDFSVFHYNKPTKNHIYVATLSTEEFEKGLKEAIMFLSFDLYSEIFYEEED